MVVGQRRAPGEVRMLHPVPLGVQLRLLTASSYAYYRYLSLHENDVYHLGSCDGNGGGGGGDDDGDDG